MSLSPVNGTSPGGIDPANASTLTGTARVGGIVPTSWLSSVPPEAAFNTAAAQSLFAAIWATPSSFDPVPAEPPVPPNAVRG